MKVISNLIAVSAFIFAVNANAINTSESYFIDYNNQTSDRIEDIKYMGLNLDSDEVNFSEDASANSDELELAQAGAWYCVVNPNFYCYMAPGIVTAQGASCTCPAANGRRYSGIVTWINY